MKPCANLLKHRNPLTNRCVFRTKRKTLRVLKDCKPGQVRNIETRRCRKEKKRYKLSLMEIANVMIDESGKHKLSLAESDRIHRILQKEHLKKGVTRARVHAVINRETR